MQKAKEYDWKDSNLALFGSDTEKKVKKDAAETEPAWQGSGQEVGLEVWRINKFKVERVPKDEHGTFFSGDSYILLNTYIEEDNPDKLLYDVHFWIGKYSTQDEYGTAAYKTVELDTFHDDKPVQHREVMGHESRLFKGYFDDMRLMKGGYDTGFKRVLPENLPKRLFQIVRDDATRKTICKEIPMKQGNLNDCDVFIIDNGLEGLYQYNGKDSNMNEKYKAAAEVQKIESERSGKVSGTVIDGHSIGEGHPALKYFKQGKSKEKTAPVKGPPMMFKVSDEDGSLDAEEILNGSLNKELLNSKDVFIIDDGEEVFVWVGGEASVDERKNSMAYAHAHLKKTEDPFKPIHVVAEGKESKSFNAIWG